MSGYYNVKAAGDESQKLVFCDMESGNYNEVPQIDAMSYSPIGTILAWEMEDSQIEDHEHEDNGHEHSCSATSSSSSHNHGHKAAYSEDGASSGEGGESTCSHAECSGWAAIRYSKSLTSSSASASVSTSCSLGSSSSGLGGVSSGANSGVETRPVNMKVMYIIRVY